MRDFSYILRLENFNFKGVTNIKRVPGIETINYPKKGKVFGVKYYITNKKGNFPIRFTSEDKNFKTLYSFDFYDAKYNPSVGNLLKDDSDPVKFLELLEKIFISLKKPKKRFFNIKEEIMLETPESDMKQAAIVNAIAGLFLSLLLIGQFLYYFIRKQILLRKEREAEIAAEREINNSLFKGQTGKEEVYKIYDNLIRFVDYIAKGSLKSLIIYGKPGTGKTHMVRRTFHFSGIKPRRDYVIEKGSSLGLAETYQLFFDNRDKIIVLDDFDTPLKNSDMVNMLKALTDSYGKRILSLPREKVMQTGQNLQAVDAPEKFVFNGKLIIITNLNRNEIDKALLSRSPAVEVNFSTEEVIENLKKMMIYVNPGIPMDVKKDTYEYIMSLKEKDPNIKLDFRGFQSAVEIKHCIPIGWEDMIKTIIEYKGR